MVSRLIGAQSSPSADIRPAKVGSARIQLLVVQMQIAFLALLSLQYLQAMTSRAPALDPAVLFHRSKARHARRCHDPCEILGPGLGAG